MVHSKIMNHMVDEDTANQIKEYIDARNPYNLLRLVAPSIQYIRQNLDVLPGMGRKIRMIFLINPYLRWNSAIPHSTGNIYEIDLYDFAEELHEYFGFYALVVTSTPILTSIIMLSIVRSRCFEWTPQKQGLLGNYAVITKDGK